MGRPVLTIISGTRYGHLITTGVYIPFYRNGKKQILGKVECKCDCGNISLKQLGALKSGSTSCCSAKCPNFVSVTHGLSQDENGKHTKEYKAWINMIARCTNPKHPLYVRTDGRGISYHESLSTIEGFWDVMGKSPSKSHKFCRIDKDRNYEPGNVHWYLASKCK